MFFGPRNLTLSPTISPGEEVPRGDWVLVKAAQPSDPDLDESRRRNTVFGEGKPRKKRPFWGDHFCSILYEEVIGISEVQGYLLHRIL